jgi:hypothetical protein
MTQFGMVEVMSSEGWAAVLLQQKNTARGTAMHLGWIRVSPRAFWFMVVMCEIKDENVLSLEISVINIIVA